MIYIPHYSNTSWTYIGEKDNLPERDQNTYLCGGEQYVNVFQSKMELDKKSNNICDTQQGEKGENAFQTFPVKFENMGGVLKIKLMQFI